MISRYAPGYPIVVGTPSVPTGIYWVDKTAPAHRNNLVTFPFEPKAAWLRERYGDEHVHTKLLKGLPGDTIHADNANNLTLCHHLQDEVGPPDCEPVGKVQEKDSKGRPLFSWVPANQGYVLKAGEYWVYSPHPKSLDSRYHGPIESASVTGVATPIWLFRIGSN
ncbi:S26 family signal peptidase [Novimethylophilus kurashikiensis]